MDFGEEDNNPFAGTSHLFASGISSVNGGFGESYYNGFNDGFMAKHEEDEEEKEQETEESSAPFIESSYGAPSTNDYEEEYHPLPSYNNIYIADAGQIRDAKGNKIIGYTILYNGVQINRRYSEFDSLRKNLKRLFPTLIIPSIPEKHSIVKYFMNPLNVKNDLKVIEKRKRLLSIFLQKCLAIDIISQCFIFQQFLTPDVQWNEVLVSPPISILPQNNLLAPPLNPVKPSPLHLLLPIPQASSINNYKCREEDRSIEKEFQEYEQIFKVYKSHTTNMLKNVKKQKRHFKGLIKDLGELGAYYNAFSLEDRLMELSIAIEKTGQAIDINYLNSEAFNFKILTILEEPIIDVLNNSDEVLNVLWFRRLKCVQLFIIDTTIKRREQRLNNLKNVKEQAQRLEEILKKNAEQSPTIAAAVKRLENGESIKNLSPWQKILGGKQEGDITDMNDYERELEIEKIEKELVKLNDCLKVIVRDIEEVNESIRHNLQTLLKEFNLKWKEIMRQYSKSLLIWLEDNLESWKEAKREIENIEIKKPVEL